MYDEKETKMSGHPMKSKRRQALAPTLGALFAFVWVLISTLQAGGQESPEPEISSAPEPPAVTVVSGTIDGEINNVVAAYVKRLVTEVETRGAGALFLELNTFGGRVDSAVVIRDALIDLEVPTLIFINKRAISAGALISFACDRIVMAPGGTIGAATPVMSGSGGEVPQAVEEKYLSYFREEMRSTAETKGRDADLAEAMVDKDKVVEGVSEEGKLLTLTTNRAVELGLAEFQAGTAEEALEQLGYPQGAEELARSWSEDLVGFLTSQAVASLLLMGMMIFAYLEYQAPGFGLFGGLAIGCFLILFFSHYMVNLAGWEELILFVVGLVLLGLEIFVIPGFGVAGILGMLSILASGVLVLMAGDWSDFSISNPFSVAAVQQVLISTLLGIAVLMLLIRFLPKNGIAGGSGLILGTSLAGGAALEPKEGRSPEDDLVGQIGDALSPLRPAGRARFGDRRLEVESEGGFIEEGSRIRVLRREGHRLIVREAPASTEEG